MNWTIVDFKDIPGEEVVDDYFNPISRYEFNQIWVSDRAQVLLLGTDKSADRATGNINELLGKRKAVLFLSKDGGSTLKKVTIGDGNLQEGGAWGAATYLLNTVQTEQGESTELLKFHVETEQWELVQHFSAEHMFMASFYNEQVGIASFMASGASATPNSSERRYTLDAGKTWHRITVPEPEFNLLSSEELEYVANNRDEVTYNFKTQQETARQKEVIPTGYSFQGYIVDATKHEKYYLLSRESTEDMAIQRTSGELLLLPKDASHVSVEHGLLQYIKKEGSYHDYVWSDDFGKTWQTEKIRDFFIIPTPIAYSQGQVYVFATLFKGKEEERGGRFVIGKPTR